MREGSTPGEREKKGGRREERRTGQVKGEETGVLRRCNTSSHTEDEGLILLIILRIENPKRIVVRATVIFDTNGTRVP